MAAGEGVVGGERDERARVLAALGQEVVGDGFGGGDRIERRRPLAVHFGQPWPAARPRNQPLQFIGLKHLSRRMQQMRVGWRRFRRRVLSHSGHFIHLVAGLHSYLRLSRGSGC